MMLDDEGKAFVVDAVAKMGEALIAMIREDLVVLRADIADVAGKLDVVGASQIELQLDMQDVKRHVVSISRDGIVDKSRLETFWKKTEGRLTALEKVVATLKSELGGKGS